MLYSGHHVRTVVYETLKEGQRNITIGSYFQDKNLLLKLISTVRDLNKCLNPKLNLLRI